MASVAQIIDVTAPVSANAGDSVIVPVSVKNLSGQLTTIAVTGIFNSSPMSFQFDYLNVAPGETIVMTGNFLMPNGSVTVTVWSWYWDGTQWIQDDAKTITITLPQAGANWVAIDKVVMALITAPPQTSSQWVVIDKVTGSLNTAPSESSGNWIVVDKITASLIHIAKPPPGGGGTTNWLPIALVGAGVAVVAALAIPKSNREKVSTAIKKVMR